MLNIYLDNKIDCEYCDENDTIFEIYNGKFLCLACTEELDESNNVSAFIHYKGENKHD